MGKLFTELVLLAADAASVGAVGKLREARIAFGRDLLLDRVRLTDITIESAAEQDEAIAMILKFCEGCREGAAAENLRLLAEVLAGRLNHRPIRAGDYLLLSDVIKGLMPEEIVFLGVCGKRIRAQSQGSSKTKTCTRKREIARMRLWSGLVNYALISSNSR